MERLHKQEKGLISFLFFVFGVGIMSWIPRFPDVKANLGVSNGEFGTLISMSAVGSVLSLLTVGHLVHRFGAKSMFYGISTLLYFSFIAIVFITNPFLFLVAIIVMSFASSGFHVVLNGQGFHTQERQQRHLITGWHGMWSGGAMIGAIASGFLIGHVDVQTHITVISIVAWATTIISVRRLKPHLMQAHTDEDEKVSIKAVFTDFHFDWFISIAMISAIMLEVSSGDWATIYTKETLGVKTGLSALPYILFTAAMIYGRLNSAWLMARYQLDWLIRRGAVFGSIGFAIFFFPAALIHHSHHWLAYVLTCIAFTVGGLGSSILGPNFFNVANSRSPHSGAVVTGQLGVLNQFFLFTFKTIVAWTGQLSGSIAIAFLIPTVLLFSSRWYAKVFKTS